MTEELNAAIEEFNKNAYETPTPTPPPPVNNGGNNNSNNGNNNNDNNDNNDSSDENVPPSVGDLGERIYAAAYAKLGKLYWWGKIRS